MRIAINSIILSLVFVFLLFTTNAISSIVYVSDQTGTRQIWVMESANSEPDKLTDTEGEKRWPKWSEDGEKIAYINTKSNNEIEICVLDYESSNINHISTSSNPKDIAWGPNSQTIYYSHSSHKISSIEIDSSEETLIHEHTPYSGTHGFSSFGLSKDGKKIAYAFEDVNWTPYDKIFLYDINKSERTKIYKKDNKKDGNVAFSRDGERIIWNTDVNEDPYNPIFHIYKMNIDSSNPEDITSDYNDLSFHHPCYSTDGDKIYLSAANLPRDQHKNDIYVMDADGSNLQNITDTPDANEYFPNVYNHEDESFTAEAKLRNYPECPNQDKIVDEHDWVFLEAFPENASSYKWQQVGGDIDVSLSNANSQNPYFMAKEVNSDGNVTLSVSVDNGETTKRDKLTIEVSDINDSCSRKWDYIECIKMTANHITDGSGVGYISYAGEESPNKGPAKGTCFLINKDIVLTNWHVIKEYNSTVQNFYVNFRDKRESCKSANPVSKCSEGSYVEKVLDHGSDFFSCFNPVGDDFCILRLKKQITGSKIYSLDFRKATVGEKIYTIGHPDKLNSSQGFLCGVVGKVHNFLGYFKTFVEGTHGASGSPVFDKDGEVIGIYTGTCSANIFVQNILIESIQDKIEPYLPNSTDLSKLSDNEAVEQQTLPDGTKLDPHGNIFCKTYNKQKGISIGEDNTLTTFSTLANRATTSPSNQAILTYKNPVSWVQIEVADFEGNTKLKAFNKNDQLLVEQSIKKPYVEDYSFSNVGEIKKITIESESAWMGKILYNFAQDSDGEDEDSDDGSGGGGGGGCIMNPDSTRGMSWLFLLTIPAVIMFRKIRV